MKKLTHLDASHSSISDLTGLKFATNLTSLNLYYHKITTLPSGVFEGLSKVTSLNLKSKLLTTIKAGAFDGLSSLTTLDLSQMPLATIEGGAFNGLTNLQSLNLYYHKNHYTPFGRVRGTLQSNIAEFEK